MVIVLTFICRVRASSRCFALSADAVWLSSRFLRLSYWTVFCLPWRSISAISARVFLMLSCQSLKASSASLIFLRPSSPLTMIFSRRSSSLIFEAITAGFVR